MAALGRQSTDYPHTRDTSLMSLEISFHVRCWQIFDIPMNVPDPYLTIGRDETNSRNRAFPGGK